MSSVIVLIVALVWLACGYRFYGATLSRVLGIDPTRPTPAHRLRDDVDFVPARNWLVLFGHHFSSICGAGPIVGPVLAVAYWGWGFSILWVLIGCVLLGAVSDFVALVVSVREDGHSIPEIAKPEISSRARLLFSLFIWVSLVLVIAVFAILAAKTFIEQPHVVLPSLGLIPVAVLTGYLFYETKMRNSYVTLIGLGLLGLALLGGGELPIELGSLGPFEAEQLWTLVLLAYCFVASVTPVQMLLQPRDYLASFLLFGAIGVGVASVMISHPRMQEVAFTSFSPKSWAGAGPLWPMLFVTIACGAISGFHTLVSSGTTCKQLDSEAHACRIGYGAMLVEGLVGILVVVCVGAALSRAELEGVLRSGGPIPAFGKGYGVIAKPLLAGYGAAFAVMALNAFILTTLDTATRIARYLSQELFGIGNMYLATAAVVVASATLALSGRWARIWPAFGTSNQLIAGLSLLVVSCWLLRRGGKITYTVIPACVMLVTTIAAFAYQIWASLAANGDRFMAAMNALLVALGLIVSFEAFRVLRPAAARRPGKAPLRAHARESH